MLFNMAVVAVAVDQPRRQDLFNMNGSQCSDQFMLQRSNGAWASIHAYMEDMAMLSRK